MDSIPVSTTKAYKELTELRKQIEDEKENLRNAKQLVANSPEVRAKQAILDRLQGQIFEQNAQLLKHRQEANLNEKLDAKGLVVEIKKKKGELAEITKVHSDTLKRFGHEKLRGETRIQELRKQAEELEAYCEKLKTQTAGSSST